MPDFAGGLETGACGGGDNTTGAPFGPVGKGVCEALAGDEALFALCSGASSCGGGSGAAGGGRGAGASGGDGGGLYSGGGGSGGGGGGGGGGGVVDGSVAGCVVLDLGGTKTGSEVSGGAGSDAVDFGAAATFGVDPIWETEGPFACG